MRSCPLTQLMRRQVCGIVVSVRKNQDRLSLWLRAGMANEGVVLAIGTRWKLALRGSVKLGFQVGAYCLRACRLALMRLAGSRGRSEERLVVWGAHSGPDALISCVVTW